MFCFDEDGGGGEEGGMGRSGWGGVQGEEWRGVVLGISAKEADAVMVRGCERFRMRRMLQGCCLVGHSLQPDEPSSVRKIINDYESS